MRLRDNVLIQANAVGPTDLKLLIDFFKGAPLKESLVANFDDKTNKEVAEWSVNKRVRDTQVVQLSSALVDKVNTIVDDAVLSFINPFFGVDVGQCELPHVLHYGDGGHYIPHVDAETIYQDKGGLSVWLKTLNRDLSYVCFLNDDFTGGELVFPDLDLAIAPKAGTLVCFPSDHHYLHGVRPVTSGHRYTLITWLRVNGTPTMEEINRKTMNEYARVHPQQIEQPPRFMRKAVPNPTK